MFTSKLLSKLYFCRELVRRDGARSFAYYSNASFFYLQETPHSAYRTRFTQLFVVIETDLSASASTFYFI